MKNNLFSVLVERIRNQSHPFIESADGRVLTYGDAFEAAGRLAGVLRSLGVKPGDRFAAQVEKSIEAILFYLACLKSGAVYLPLNTAYTPAELEYFIADAQPRVFIVAPERREAL